MISHHSRQLQAHASKQRGRQWALVIHNANICLRGTWEQNINGSGEIRLKLDWSAPSSVRKGKQIMLLRSETCTLTACSSYIIIQNSASWREICVVVVWFKEMHAAFDFCYFFSILFLIPSSRKILMKIHNNLVMKDCATFDIFDHNNMDVWSQITCRALSCSGLSCNTRRVLVLKLWYCVIRELIQLEFCLYKTNSFF